jgi:hypothetical protein
VPRRALGCVGLYSGCRARRAQRRRAASQRRSTPPAPTPAARTPRRRSRCARSAWRARASASSAPPLQIGRAHV